MEPTSLCFSERSRHVEVDTEMDPVGVKGIGELATGMSRICRLKAVPVRLRCLVVFRPTPCALRHGHSAPTGHFVPSGAWTGAKGGGCRSAASDSSWAK